MKTIFKTIIAVSSVAATSFISWSCMKDDGGYDMSLYFPSAVVTVKPLDAEGSSFYMQLDDKTTLKPVNITKSPYKEKEVRAFVNYNYTNDDSGEYDYAVNINWIDSLLTKQMADNTLEDIDKEYGTDPVEILRGWTVVEDGYFTIDFATKTAGYGGKHWINLVYTGNPEATEDSEKYVVEFKHDADGDNYGRMAEGYVAFRLDGEYGLPDTEGKTVKLTLKWNSYSGPKSAPKSATFNYCTRGSGASGDTGDGSGEGDLNEGGSTDISKGAKLRIE